MSLNLSTREVKKKRLFPVYCEDINCNHYIKVGEHCWRYSYINYDTDFNCSYVCNRCHEKFKQRGS